jgi:nicotinamidase-related amidase
VIDKPTKGALTYTDFELLLRNRGVRNLALCGVCTDVCAHTTMREAADRGYDCLLVTDAC